MNGLMTREGSWARVLAVWLFGGMLVGHAAPAPLGAEQVLSQGVERSTSAVAVLEGRELTYSKRSITEQLDDKGEVKKREERCYQVHFKDGLVAMNRADTDEAESGKEEKEEQEEDDDSRAMKRPRGEEKPLVLTDELVNRYEFSVAEPAKVGSRLCYVLDFEPKPGLKGSGLKERFLNRLAGRLYVDPKESEVVRAEVRLSSPLTIMGGLVGALNRFEYEVDRDQIAPGFWFNRRSKSAFEVRKLLISRRYRTQSEWDDIQVK